jgi:hypothetical protein
MFEVFEGSFAHGGLCKPLTDGRERCFLLMTMFVKTNSTVAVVEGRAARDWVEDHSAR